MENNQNTYKPISVNEMKDIIEKMSEELKGKGNNTNAVYYYHKGLLEEIYVEHGKEGLKEFLDNVKVTTTFEGYKYINEKIND